MNTHQTWLLEPTRSDLQMEIIKKERHIIVWAIIAISGWSFFFWMLARATQT